MSDLLESAKEAREACAAMMRVLARHGLAEEAMDECAKAGVRDGFGVRLQNAIQAVDNPPSLHATDPKA